MSKVAKTPPVLDKSIKMEDDYLKSRRALTALFNTDIGTGMLRSLGEHIN